MAAIVVLPPLPWTAIVRVVRDTLARCVRRHDLDDVSQDVLVQLWSTWLRAPVPILSCFAYARVVAVTQGLVYLRRSLNSRLRSNKESTLGDKPTSLDEGDGQPSRRAAARALMRERVFPVLTPQERTVLLNLPFARTVRELAQDLGIEERNLRRALEHIEAKARLIFPPPCTRSGDGVAAG
jgi:DNA-directed RNA polymerase specialized sigma24 family protein